MKVHLNADLREVYKRLAEKHNAGEVRRDEHSIRNAEVESSSLSTGPKIDER